MALRSRTVMSPAALLLAFVAFARAAPPAAAEPPVPVEEVAALLTGTFDSAEQAAADPERVRAERLVAVRVPGSRLGAGAPVLYVEQALLATPDRPFRQRFYRVEETADGGVVLRVLEPRVPVAVSGKWRDPSDLALFGAGDVVERLGCAVRLKRDDGGWKGSTEGKGCPSALSGARYATSESALRDGRLESWDRGYDLEGRQVWGPKAGPVAFVRRSAGPPSEKSR